jgi:DNA repair ATPase RecN
VSSVIKCEMCHRPVSHTEFTLQGGMVLHVGCLFQQWQGQQAEIEQLREEAQINRDLIAEINHQQQEIERLRRRETELTAVIEAQLHRVKDLGTDAKRLRDFAERVYRDQFSPGWLHDRAAKLLDLPSLAHGCDDTEEGG